MRPVIVAALTHAVDATAGLLQNDRALGQIEAAAQALIEAFGRDGRVFSCGNGGSFCDAVHFAEELSGRFRAERRPLPAMAISDAGHITCVANDYGYDEVFARFIEAHGRTGDVLVAISTSGASGNIVAAAARARAMGLTVIALTGASGSALGAEARIEICTPVGVYTDRVQELHIKVIHVLIELVERSLYPGNYSTAPGRAVA